MGLTRDFRETVLARARCDPEFRVALLTESIQCFLEGDVETGKAVLRNYINATIGFDELSSQTGKPSKSPNENVRPPTAIHKPITCSRLSATSSNTNKFIWK